MRVLHTHTERKSTSLLPKPSYYTVLDVLHQQHIEGDVVHPAPQNRRVGDEIMHTNVYVWYSGAFAIKGISRCQYLDSVCVHLHSTGAIPTLNLVCLE